MCANTAVVLLPLGISAINCPPITLWQEDIHGFRNDMLLAIGTFYLLSYRTVGLKIDGNLCPYLLSPSTTHQVPWPECRSLCEPFWSRFADKSCTSSWLLSLDILGCIAPTATLQATPRPLKRATEACFAARKGLNSRGSFSSQHLDAFLTCLKAKIDKLYALFLFALSFPGTFEKTQFIIIITLGAIIPL